jgi:hypothetical protein
MNFSMSMSMSNNCRLYIHTKRHGLVQRHATTRKNILAGIFALLYYTLLRVSDVSSTEGVNCHILSWRSRAKTCRLCESTLVDLCADAWKIAGQSEQQAQISLSLYLTHICTHTHTHTHICRSDFSSSCVILRDGQPRLAITDGRGALPYHRQQTALPQILLRSLSMMMQPFEAEARLNNI